MLKTIMFVLAFYFILLPANADEFESFKLIYNKQCATCHGPSGDGKGRAGVSFTPPATNFTSIEYRTHLSQAKMISAIRDGVPGTAMSAYGKRFDESTVVGLVNYIQQQFVDKKALFAEEDAAAEGGVIYAEHCSACHGDKGSTAVWAKNALNPAPRDFTSALAKAELSLDRMLLSVTRGRSGTAMMSFESRLNKAQILSVVTFIRQTFMQLDSNERAEARVSHASPSPVNFVDMLLPFSNGLTGDAEVGEVFFQNNCFSCHGEKGDGKGPRAHFNIPGPLDFTSAESRSMLNRPKLFRGISYGKPRTVMPAWSAVLSEQQIADVAEYVFQAFVQTTFQKKKR